VSEFTLYGYFRSSASYRVRIALNLKGVSFDQAPVHLLRAGGEQLSERFRTINPDGLVPALVHVVNGKSHTLTQSLAIIEYLDDLIADPPLLPHSASDRAYVRSIALQIACEIHPVDNLRVLKYLTNELGALNAQRDKWYRHWLELGFESLERRLADPRVGAFVHGDTPTIADLCLVPQVWNARRFNIPIDAYPTIRRLADHAMGISAFARAEPSMQPDAE